MRYLNDTEEFEAIRWMKEAGRVAEKALCLKNKCGTVIVKDNSVIGSGYNAPPLDDEQQRTCLDEYIFSEKKKFDRTCCMHAEWRAILDALRSSPEKIVGAKLYFMRLDSEGAMTRAGKPYCTVCSRLALDSGIKEFHLWHDEGVASYPTDEYNRISYEFLRQ